MDLKASFDQVYKHKLWTDNGKYTLSGPGSEIECAKNIIKFLIHFIKENNIKRIIDGSCGDCMWIMKVLNEFPDVEYIGYDISQEIININKEKYSKYSFYQQNLLELKELPTCDLFIIRHTMMHLSLKDNIILIDMLKKNSNCFIALTHHEVNKNNDGEPHGLNFSSLKWSQKNLHIKPFELEKFLIEKIKENTNNSNEYFCVYKFN